MFYVNKDTSVAYTDILICPSLMIKTEDIRSLVVIYRDMLIKQVPEYLEIEKLVIFAWKGHTDREFVEVYLNRGKIMTFSVKKSATLGDLRFWCNHVQSNIGKRNRGVSKVFADSILFAYEKSLRDYLKYINQSEADAFLYFIDNDVSEIRLDGIVNHFMELFSFHLYKDEYRMKFFRYIIEYIHIVGSTPLSYKRTVQSKIKENPSVLFITDKAMSDDDFKMHKKDYIFYAYVLLSSSPYHNAYDLKFSSIKKLGTGNIKVYFRSKE